MIDLENQYFENIPRKPLSTGSIMELTVDKELFRLYTLCAGLLMGKTIIMSIITARARFAHHVSTNMFLFFSMTNIRNENWRCYKKWNKLFNNSRYLLIRKMANIFREEKLPTIIHTSSAQGGHIKMTLRIFMHSY